MLRLVQYGTQDYYLTGTPNQNISFDKLSNIPKSKNIYLNHTKYSEKSGKYSCSICLSDFIQDDKIHITDCNHTFHHKCLQNYLKTLKDYKSFYNCPLCRTQNGIIYSEL